MPASFPLRLIAGVIAAFFAAPLPAIAAETSMPPSPPSATAPPASAPALTDLQKDVIMNKGTERPFTGQYWNNKEEGIYVDLISGEPLFSSTDKYDSGTGWPSFTKPIREQSARMSADHSDGMVRTEVTSASGAHLGHVFDDGPKDRGGKRFCINSAALRFVPKAKMKEEGYGQYLYLFEGKK